MANMQNPRSRTGIVSANTQVKPVMQAPNQPPQAPGSMLPGMAGDAVGASNTTNSIFSSPNKPSTGSKNSYGQQPGSTPGSKNSYGQQPGQAPGMMNAMGAMGGVGGAGQPGSLIDMQENPYNGTSFFGGNNEPPMGPMPPAGNQGGSGGFQSPNPYQNPYAGRVSSTGGGSSRPRSTYDTSVDGVSAVNPQGGTMDKWVDEAYSNAMTRLNPQMDQQKASFDQAMVDRGIPVGSEAYNKALQQMDMNQNDARQNAMFNAMGFGRDTQQQMFGQDAQRSQLANALLQARMGNELQWDNSAMNWENMGNQWNYAWDRANQSDLSWLDNMNFRDRSYNDQQDWMQYNARNAMLGAIPGWNPMQIDVNGSANQAYNSQYGNANLQNQQNQNAWSQWMDLLGTGAGMYAMSDRRLKEDITPIGVIDGVNIYTWEWNDEAKRLGVGDEPRIGVIAQEVPAQFTTVRDGYLAVNYDGLFGGV